MHNPIANTVIIVSIGAFYTALTLLMRKAQLQHRIRKNKAVLGIVIILGIATFLASLIFPPVAQPLKSILFIVRICITFIMGSIGWIYLAATTDIQSSIPIALYNLAIYSIVVLQRILILIGRPEIKDPQIPHNEDLTHLVARLTVIWSLNRGLQGAMIISFLFMVLSAGYFYTTQKNHD